RFPRCRRRGPDSSWLHCAASSQADSHVSDERAMRSGTSGPSGRTGGPSSGLTWPSKITAMTRGPRWLIVTVALVATLGGCAPAGGDGDVVDDWGALPSAAPIVPPSGVCYASSLTNANRIDAAASDRLPCDQQHAVETYHVGQFPPNVAAVPTVGHPD